MGEEIIKNNEQKNSELIRDGMDDTSFSNKLVANTYVKILWKKRFKKSEVQEHDNQIVAVVQDVYLAPEYRKECVWDWVLDKETSNVFHAAYRHRNDDIVLVCYRGTDFKNLQDLLSDVHIVLWVNSIDTRVTRSLDFYDEIQMKYPNMKKWVCWHSLWWTISYIVTKHRAPDRCIVFNPWASPTKTFLWMLKDTLFKKAWTKTITTYKIWGDVISTLSFVWNVRSFVLKTANPLKLHSIDSFPDLFKNEKGE